MDAVDMLNKWAEYAEYDPNQTRFNLLSDNYEMHKCCDNIAKIQQYDPTGAIALMYAKEIFLKLCKEKRVTLYDLLKAPGSLAEERSMWTMFFSEDMDNIERGLLNSIDKLVREVIPAKLLGDRDLDAERTALISSATSVVEELGKLHTDLFLRGQGPIGEIHKLSTHIHVFERLAECLLALERAEDGIYLCYINNAGSADGYFGFYIKSNGNILSINERVNEAFPGEHANSRNGRWSEAKAFSLFPYQFIFEFTEHDYKGYASKHIIDQERLAFFQLDAGAYMPLLLAMVMLMYKYNGADTEQMPLKYVDSLLEVNLAMQTPGTTALTVPKDSAIALKHRDLTIQMTEQDVLGTSLSERFNRGKDKDYLETGSFPTKESIFVKLYGEGFKLDADSLLVTDRHPKALAAKELSLSTSNVPNIEYVGTENRLHMLAYSNARAQLAEYIRDKMFEEYKAFGGVSAVVKWYKSALLANKEHLFHLCVEKYMKVQADEEKNLNPREWRDVSDNPLRFISYQKDVTSSSAWIPFNGYPFNRAQGYTKYGKHNGRFSCPITGKTASIFFTFKPNNDKELAVLVGADNIPKIVKGWALDGHRGIGNPLLNATDKVFEVGTPFETWEVQSNWRYWRRQDWSDYYFHHASQYPDWTTRKPSVETIEENPVYNFSFAIGFSKNGFKRFLKEYETE